MLRSLFILFTCTVSVSSLDARAALACDCDPPSQKEVFTNASAVFIGEVIDIRPSAVSLFGHKSAPRSSYAVTFRVIESWKGVRGQEIVVHSDLGALPCYQFAFRKHRKYIVYAFGSNLIAITGCTRSSPVESTTYYLNELKALGPGSKRKS